ncbi:helicase-exonuclease AddAB subunit AddA [Lacticaseibacillus jixianensis]|uniref:DNA 3'-5' helicase n=1 Tax=Lacticaseibacillus jixianensis TaxID=2486012 RepID=A0ABW4BD91_9LACO|nr:helicase-exonuclease AddAB subunit AddA [Lacticaseibacillus jixianensis]
MTEQVKRTPDQERAVTLQGTDLLVSASAGSGKTKVLVDRIIHRLLTDPDASLSKMLIVTFTNAATAEMKLKIETKLRERLAAGELTADQHQRLAKEIAQASAANIMTLDAFSKQVVDHYYYVIDLDPGYRMLTDDTEVLLLKTRVWEDLRVNLLSAPAHREAFEALTANFAARATQDGLQEVVFALYEYAMTTKDPVGYLKRLAADYQDNEAAWMGKIWQTVRPAALHAVALLTQAFELVAGIPASKPWADIIAPSLAAARQLAGLTEPTYAAAFEAVQALTFPTWKAARAKKYDDVRDAVQTAQQLRDEAKALLTAQQAWFTITPGDLAAALPQTRQLAQTLQAVMLEYLRAMTAEKAARRVQTFGDIAQNALKILNTPLPDDSGLTVGDHYRQQFREVLVDEYQDINPLQDGLLDAVSRTHPGNRFMVGDVKQSIYGFRLADPQKFLTRYHRYSQPASDGQLVTLNQNFRSTENVLAFTNLVFGQLMDEALGDIAYTEAERLHENQGYDYQDETDQKTHAYRLSTELLIEVAKPEAPAQASEQPAAADAADGEDVSAAQARLVAARIQQLVAPDSPARLYVKEAQPGQTGKARHERRVRYRDITLLTRTQSNNIALQQAFAEAGIPIVITKTQNFFKTTELMVMLSLLRVIDNPKQEIPLTAVLRSPLVGLTADDLARIRLFAPGPYDEAVLAYAQQPAPKTPAAAALQQKLAAFTQSLAELRTYARTHELSALIWHIYEQTGFLEIAGSQVGGRQRQANLRALAARAAEYEKSGFKGLFAFVRFIETMQKQNKDLALPVALAPDVDAVSLMTIHGSKGLQFPIVFLLNTEKPFNKQDLKRPFILSQGQAAGPDAAKPELVGLKFRDPQTFLEYPLPQWQLAKAEKTRQLLAEEMRLLYVALTRAEQQLFIVGTAKSQGHLLTQAQLEANWLKAAANSDLVLPAALRMSAQSPLDWLGMTLARTGALAGAPALGALAADAAKANIVFNFQDQPLAAAAQLPQAPAQAAPALPDFSAQLADWLNARYPDQLGTTTTGFQSVTELKRVFEDPAVADAQPAAFPKGGQRLTGDFATPTFLQDDAAVSATAVGTATHLLLQQVALTGPLDEAALGAAADALAQAGLITPAVRAHLPLAKVAAFFTTPLGQQLQAAPARVHREQAFSLLWPASALLAAQTAASVGHVEGDVLVHGVIDGFIDQPEGIILFDYKTDHIGTHLAQVIDRYQGQLEVYAQALMLMTHRPVQHRYLVLLETGDVHEVLPVVKPATN